MISIPISDFSVVNALGGDRAVFGERLFAGQSGLVKSLTPIATELGRIDTLPALPQELAIYESRVARIAWLAARQIAATVDAAVRRWGPERIAIVVGSSTGGIESSERAYAVYRSTGQLPRDYSFENGVSFDALSRLLRHAFGTQGPSYVISTACSSSSKALAAAQRLIASGRVDAVIAGGADSLCDTTLFGFHGLGVLSKERCEPFAEGRSGINLGEGAAFFVLEREADAAFQLLGAGESADAHHLSSPHPEGAGACLALERALECSGLEIEQVDYINAHGTGTDLNDSTEAMAIRSLFPHRVPVSSTKGATGHLLGACGATEAAVCLLALEQQKVPPNLLSHHLDRTLDLEIVTTTRNEKIRSALSNSLAFGGSNVTLAFARSDFAASRSARPKVPAQSSTVQVVAAATWPPLGADGELITHPGTAPATLLPARARGRASSLTRLFAEVIAEVQGFASGDPALLPIVYGSAAGEMETTLVLLEHLTEGTSSPVRFQASVHNTASGLISIATHNQAFSTAVAAGAETVAMAFIEAIAWLKTYGGELIVTVADEAAVPLLNGKTYPAFAAAFLLRQVESAADTPALLLGDPQRSGGATSNADVHDNPCLPALELARKIRTRAAGPVSLTHSGEVKWQVALQTS